MSREIFTVGRVVKPHGLRGCMKAVSYLESGELLHDLENVYLGREGLEEGPFKVESIGIKKKIFILKVAGIDNAEAAGRWAGSDVLAPTSVLKKLPEGEYYWHDLFGLRVITEEGRYLGRIEQIFPTGSNDVYVCKGGEKEILLPAIEDVIRKVDTGEGIMVVRLYEGL